MTPKQMAEKLCSVQKFGDNTTNPLRGLWELCKNGIIIIKKKI